MAVTLGIAITSGLVVGFVASKLPSPVELFDDKAHFAHVNYVDDLSEFNNEKHEDKAAEKTIELPNHSGRIQDHE